jgi:sugar lactone lactonase YvrE
MRVCRLAGWKAAPVAVLATIIMVAGALAFPPGNAGDTVADNVLGQPDFVHNRPNTPNATSLDTAGSPARVAIDKSAPNPVYVADVLNNRVLGYPSLSALANGAAAAIVIGQPDFFTTTPNTYGRSAQSLANPEGVAVDSTGNLWVADSNNNRVLEYSKPFSQTITAGFTADTVLGQGDDFTSTGCNTNGGPGSSNFCTPEGIAFDASNHLWVADTFNSRILEFNTPLISDAADFVIGQPNFVSNTCNNGGVGTTSLCHATDVAVDSNNNVYVADFDNARVLEYNTALASLSRTANHVWGTGGSFKTTGCGVSAASLCFPTGVGLDGSNNLYIADTSNNRILEYNETANPPTNLTANRVFGQAGNFTATSCNQGNPNQLPSATSLCNPQDTQVSGSKLVAADTSNNRVLIYDTPLTSQTANVELGQPDFVHDAANTVDAEGMDGTAGIAIDASNHLYIVDQTNNRVLGYSNAGAFTNDAPAFLVIGQRDFFSSFPNEGAPVSSSGFSAPASVATDSSGNLYVSDFNNNRVLEYNAPFLQNKTQGFSANKVYGQSGSFTSSACPNPPNANSLCQPDGLAVDTHNNLYVADHLNNRVLVYASGSTTATREFGQGTTGTNFTSNTPNDDGLGPSSLNDPFGVATDSNNNVYIADSGNNRALEYKETANPPTNFAANTVFGQGGNFNSTNFCNEGGLTANSLCNPRKVALDAHSNLYISDATNNRVLEYNTPLTSVTGTTATRVFGQADSFSAGICNFDGGPSADSLCGPIGVALDSAQDLLVGDFSNNRVLKYLQPLATPGVGTLAPSPVAFGSVPQHNTSATMTVTAKNTGIVPVLFTGHSITGTNARDFAIVSDTCEGYVPSAQTCTIGVTFTPTASVGTAESATLSLFDNGISAPQTDSLTGSSAIGQTNVLPVSVKFGNVTHATTSSPQTVTLTNNQSVAISLSPAPTISAGSPTFKISSTTCGSTVAALGHCAVSVTCTPPSTGTFPGTLKFTDSPDSLSPHNVPLNCTGT